MPASCESSPYLEFDAKEGVYERKRRELFGELAKLFLWFPAAVGTSKFLGLFAYESPILATERLLITGLLGRVETRSLTELMQLSCKI